jgi:DNA replication ATP-dependent helicase Dna2
LDVGSLLRDWRRINVAVTRAKQKLILVGNYHTLCNDDTPVLQSCLKMIKRNKWKIDLPVGAHQMYPLYKYLSDGHN